MEQKIIRIKTILDRIIDKGIEDLELLKKLRSKGTFKGEHSWLIHPSRKYS